MIKGILLINGLIQLIMSIIISGQCSCSDYSVDQCLDYKQCSKNSEQCGQLNCSNIKQQERCSYLYTDYKCIWDDKNETCTSHEYSCGEVDFNQCSNRLPTKQACAQMDGKCKELQCENHSNSCPLNLCSFDHNNCSNPLTDFDCQKLDSKDCNNYFPGNGKICYTDDKGKCKTYNYYYHREYYFDYRCSEWSDSKNGCKEIECVYDESQEICRHKKCVEIKEQNKCKPNRINDDVNSIQLCQWKDNYCQEVREEDILQFSSNCQENTAYAYQMGDHEKCVKCSKTQIIVTENPCYGCCGPNFKIENCEKLMEYYPKLKHCFEFSLTQNCTQVQSEYDNLKKCFNSTQCPVCPKPTGCTECQDCSKPEPCPACTNCLGNYTCQEIASYVCSDSSQSQLDLSELSKIYHKICNMTFPIENFQTNPDNENFQAPMIAFACFSGVEFVIICILLWERCQRYCRNRYDPGVIIN